MLVAVVSAPVVGLATWASPAAAGSANQLQASIDDLARQWFQAQNQLQNLDTEIANREQIVRTLTAQSRALKLEATARAVDLYVAKPQQLVAVLDGTNALDSARRADLTERANAKNNETFDALSAAINRLQMERATLVKQRTAERATAAKIAHDRATLDAALRSVRAAALRAANQRIVAHARKVASSAPQSPGVPAQPVVSIAPVTAVPAPASPGVFPEHDNPFLVCTRAHESRGDYSVVDSSGTYFGAYQFARDTWDVTALHAGRHDLVGVLPNTASVYDQDQLAWTLYQWQGNAPWGGRC